MCQRFLLLGMYQPIHDSSSRVFYKNEFFKQKMQTFLMIIANLLFAYIFCFIQYCIVWGVTLNFHFYSLKDFQTEIAALNSKDTIFSLKPRILFFTLVLKYFKLTVVKLPISMLLINHFFCKQFMHKRNTVLYVAKRLYIQYSMQRSSCRIQ